MAVVSRDASFESRGTRCAATLTVDDAVAEPPVVVLADGFGCERSWRLPAFAERFAERGLAALAFDYRRFGDSEGMPRNLVTPRGHRADWRAAVAHARGLDGVDGDRIGLWGSSFSGGHVLATAARDGAIDAVVAQVPFSDGVRTELHLIRSGGLGYVARAVASAVRDLVRAAIGAGPYYVPIAAEPDGFAVLNGPGVLAGFESLNGGDWDNRCPARVFLTALPYRPVASAGRVDCPTLVVEAEADVVIPAGTVERLVDRLADVEHVSYPVGHFDVYTGGTFEAVVEAEGAFLERELAG